MPFKSLLVAQKSNISVKKARENIVYIPDFPNKCSDKNSNRDKIITDIKNFCLLEIIMRRILVTLNLNKLFVHHLIPLICAGS